MALTTMKRRLKAFMFRFPMMITCVEFEGFLVDYLDDKLGPDERRKFELHLKICRECREYLAAYKASLEAARQGLSGETAPLPDDVPEDLVAAVIASRGND